MAKSTGDGLAQGSHHQPQVPSNIAPTLAQRRVARALIVALLAIFAGSWPLEAIKLPDIDAFVPSLAAALFVADCVAAVLLFGQFLILRQLALLIIADGYVFSALLVVAHALAFPGAFAPHGVLVVGEGLQSAVWLYWIWHLVLPLAVIGYALLKDKDRSIAASSPRVVVSLNVVAIIAAVFGLYWFVTKYEFLLPITYVDVRPISFFRHIIGGVVTLAVGCIALYLLWVRRRSSLDLWLMVAICALVLEILLISVHGYRYSLAWYAGRFYQFITATVVMVMLLAEMTRLYSSSRSLKYDAGK